MLKPIRLRRIGQSINPQISLYKKSTEHFNRRLHSVSKWINLHLDSYEGTGPEKCMAEKEIEYISFATSQCGYYGQNKMDSKPQNNLQV